MADYEYSCFLNQEKNKFRILLLKCILRKLLPLLSLLSSTAPPPSMPLPRAPTYCLLLCPVLCPVPMGTPTATPAATPATAPATALATGPATVPARRAGGQLRWRARARRSRRAFRLAIWSRKAAARAWPPSLGCRANVGSGPETRSARWRRCFQSASWRLRSRTIAAAWVGPLAGA